MLKDYNLFAKKYSKELGRIQTLLESSDDEDILVGATDEQKSEAWSKFSYSYVALSNKYPFFFDMLVKLQVLMTEEVAIMATDGIYMMFNPLYILQKLTVDEIIFAIAHEIMHVITFTFARQGNRNPYGWNIATDHAINLMLGDEIGKRPDWVLYDKKWENMAAEEIYEQLSKKQKQDPKEQQDKDSNDAKPAKEGDYIIVNHDKSFGRITKVHEDGSYDYISVTEDEVNQAMKQ